MHVVRDLLDNQVVDRFNRKMGKVDGVVLQLRQGKPPRVTAIELGMPTLMSRISTRLGELAAALERKLGVGDGTPERIPLSRVESVGINVRVDIDADRTSVYVWERWIRRVLIDRIPGAGKGGPEAENK
jgi:sporulation protein YlmC with PRC-barrel domain